VAYDNTGATIGAAGHDAATITAALIVSGQLQGEEAVEVAFTTLQRRILDTSLALQAEIGLSAPAPSRGAPPRRATGQGNGGGGNSDPGTLDFRTGKHAGKSIAAVYDEAPDYIEWCARELKNDFMRGKCDEFLALQAA
jgi:hypothetical protein